MINSYNMINSLYFQEFSFKNNKKTSPAHALRQP